MDRTHDFNIEKQTNRAGRRILEAREIGAEPLPTPDPSVGTPALRGKLTRPLLPLLLLMLAINTGCSVKKYAINKLGDSLAKSGTTFAADDDPELVGGALPFSLKLIEGLLVESPRHRGLLFAASSGFTQYAYVYVQQDADEMEDRDLSKATALRARARRLYLRARDYGLRGLEASHRSFSNALRESPETAVRVTTRADVPLMFWTAAAWGSAISLSKDNPELIADQLIVEALIDRALELDEDFESGAIHGFLIAYEPARQGAKGDPHARSREHFRRAVELTKGRLASPFVTLAETVAIKRQDRTEFESLLNRALEIDPDARPEWTPC